uniref:Uncharacterized protein n=1 Tax=Wuchereria bancrofti TaxID=6293 RepID=A0A1I8ECM7_WUCBA
FCYPVCFNSESFILCCDKIWFLILQLTEGTNPNMALDDDDQTNWNKENIPLNEGKATCWQISQNVMQEIKQEVTRQVLAELTIKNSDESDETDGDEDNDQQSSDIYQSSFPARRSDYFSQVFDFHFKNFLVNIFSYRIFFSDFQDNESSANGSKQEQTRIVRQYQCCADDASSKDFHSIKSGDHITVKKWRNHFAPVKTGHSLERCCRNLFNQNGNRCNNTEDLNAEAPKKRGRTAISKGSNNEKRSCEGLDEFITPPLCTIPGIELECKLEECDPKTLSKIILPKVSISSGLSCEMQVQNEQFGGKVDFGND